MNTAKKAMGLSALSLILGAGFLGPGCEEQPAADPASSRDGAAPPPSEAPARGPQGLVGCWSGVIELSWPAGDTKGELCLSRADESWTGKFFLRDEWRELEALRVEDDALEFWIQTPVGKASFDVSVEGDTLRGTADGKFGVRPFRASRK